MPGVDDGSAPAATASTQRRNVVDGSPSHPTDGSPVVCDSSSRTVIVDFAPVNAGRYFTTGSSSASFPWSTNVISVAEVSHLLADAIGMTVPAVVSPTARRWRVSPSRATSRTPPARASSRTRSRMATSAASYVPAAPAAPAA